MSILNQDIERPTNPTVLKSFRNQSMRKILLDAGHELYKFTSHPLLGSPKGITPYWFSLSPLEGDRGLAGLMHDAETVHTEAKDFARARAAVAPQWGNSMSNLLRARLMTSAYAFVGQAAGQPCEDDPPSAQPMARVFLIGGAMQLWIPNLTTASIMEA